jgi:hypothetical protein
LSIIILQVQYTTLLLLVDIPAFVILDTDCCKLLIIQVS